MSQIVITTSHQARCDCGRLYGEVSENQMDIVALIREFPCCSECESAHE